MQQQQFQWATGSVVQSKDEPLTHIRQKGPTCAYHALAILTGTPIAKVLQTGKDVVRESRFRAMNGRHCMLVETYRRLGYRFPYEEVTGGIPVRVDRLSAEVLSGTGLLRVTNRATSGSGHLAAYKAGIVYDSAMYEPLEAETYLARLKRRRGHKYIRVIARESIERNGNTLTFKEQDSQAELKKQPRRSRRRYAWAY